MDYEMLEELKDALMEWCQDDEQTVSVYMNVISEWRNDSYKLMQEKQRADEAEAKLNKIAKLRGREVPASLGLTIKQGVFGFISDRSIQNLKRYIKIEKKRFYAKGYNDCLSEMQNHERGDTQ